LLRHIASWEGGDPDCDHRHETEHQRQGSTSQRSGRSNVDEQRNENFRDVCGRCGAHRVDQQLGLEATPDEYVARMVEIFREVRRVLRPDGTLWLNLGDSYASNGTKKSGGNASEARETGIHGSFKVNTSALRNRTYAGVPNRRPDGLKPKDLCMIPARVAIALQDDGWWLRSDIIWAKPNPMPESVTDRPTKSHEYLFLLSKGPRYFFDQESVREQYADPDREWWNEPISEGTLTDERRPRPKGGWGDGGVVSSRPGRGPDGRKVTSVAGADGSLQHRDGERWPNRAGRNIRSVWEIPTQSYSDAHFAVFPEELPRRCIAAGTSEHGCCPECGVPWERETETTRMVVASSAKADARREQGLRTTIGGTMLESPTSTTVGWRPGCDCGGVDFSPILTPLGEIAGEDPTMTTGRKGLDRPRGDGDGTRPITRYEQAQYAAQLNASPARPAMEAAAGATAFAHYIRTDASGARPVPPDLLEEWIANGWLERVEIPDVEQIATVPCTVLDPFMGSGTTALVARKMGRRSVGIELNREYADLVAKRTRQLSLFG
jgi:DNA modification methylase